MRWRFSAPIMAIVFLVPVSAGLARQPGAPLKPGFNLYSKDQDIEIGKLSAAKVKTQYQQVQNPEVQAYVRQLGDRLTKTPSASDSGFPFSFTVLNYKEVNAFALPGGPAFVFTGLIKASDNEAEMAGVLAHEVAHVVLRHGTHQASRENIIERPARVIGALNSLTALGRVINVGLGLGLNGIFLKYSRTSEAEADALGAHIMAEAGYDPVELARFFEKLEHQGGPGVPEFLSDHPSPGNRIEAVEAEARTLPPRQYTSDNREFERVKTVVAGLPPPPDLRPKNVVVGQAGASGYLKLSTPQFSIEYPSDWRVHRASGSAVIALVPDQGVVMDPNGNQGLGYGSVLSYFFADPGRASLADATDDLVRHLRQEDPGIRPAGTRKHAEAGKQAALITQLTGDSPFGGPETDMLVTVARPEGLFYLIFLAPEREWDAARPAFEHMLQSIHFVP